MRDLDLIRDGLARVLPDGGGITGIRAFSTGHSNETYLIEGLNQILRLPASAEALMPGSHDVIAQARIYQAVAALGLPVPAILYTGDDPAVLDDPFFVMARVAGEEVNDYQPQASFTDAPPEARGAMCETWMNIFCGLAHSAPLDILGAAISPEDQARRWQDMARAAQCDSLVAQIDRLLAIPAPRSGPVAVVHGDPKLANLMWDAGALTAVLDWELAYNGEPLSDLGYILFFFASDSHPANRACGFPGMWDRDRIIANWAAQTGRPTAGVAWYEIAAAMKMAAIIGYGHYLYTSGKSTDARFLQWKVPLDRNLVLIETLLAQL
ncbi:phosphotransferase family protein [Sphingomonas psychrolutea]|uniref:Acyl-CoA dehydrogenase n=1 Tax=Sphingomonas psychrolutea TaxID=1259676 RepID=A0ABQ1G5S3_9SPHN|nr:phosphotransferase family protein [Sphingomonas psychrolutea]GGA37237.1 acyl-CoA dehydrogenase [Sphingomonas psychrolutea]